MLQFHTNLDPADHARLQAASKALGQSAAEFLRRALRRSLDEYDVQARAAEALERARGQRP
jgi:predicted DNA-binding protein